MVTQKNIQKKKANVVMLIPMESDLVMMSYARYLANRDPFKFRAELYDIQSTNFDFLITYELSSWVGNGFS